MHRKFNISIAELDKQDMLNQGVIGISIVGNEYQQCHTVLDKVLNEIEETYAIEVYNIERMEMQNGFGTMIFGHQESRQKCRGRFTSIFAREEIKIKVDGCCKGIIGHEQINPTAHGTNDIFADGLEAEYYNKKGAPFNRAAPFYIEYIYLPSSSFKRDNSSSTAAEP